MKDKTNLEKCVGIGGKVLGREHIWKIRDPKVHSMFKELKNHCGLSEWRTGSIEAGNTQRKHPLEKQASHVKDRGSTDACASQECKMGALIKQAAMVERP